MKIKLDENLPPRAADVFVIQGHDTDTVYQEGLAGADDATVTKAATDDGRLIITLDRGFGDVQHYPPGSHAGILVLRTADQSADAICDRNPGHREPQTRTDPAAPAQSTATTSDTYALTHRSTFVMN